MTMNNPVRVRFAPSPTGPMHIGGARTTLYNYLFAKQNGGQFILRIDDTDLARNQKVFEDDIFAGIKWLGFDWDEQYRQSERIDLYKQYAQKLTDLGLTYEKDGGMYFKLPTENEEIIVDDIIRGQVSFQSKDFDDLVIFKKDGMPTYHFASAIDDIDLRITHVIRGEEHLSNTPRHLLLYKALGAPTPKFAHIPLILNEDRSKMSKRSGDTALIDFIKTGYLREALVNFLVQLGWADKTGQEFFTLDELLEKFDLARVQKAGAVFNIKHLNHLNHHYLMHKSLDEYRAIAEPYIASVIASSEAPKQSNLLNSALRLVQDRAQTLSEIPELISFFFKLPDYEAELLVFKKSSPDQTLKGLSSALKVLDALDGGEWTQAKLQSALDHTLEAEALNPGDLFWPVRVALSGNSASPSPVELLEVLGKEESLTRIKSALLKMGD